MSRSASPGVSLASTLQAAAAAYQSAEVIPHCPSCSRPCCGLDALVLELNWKQIKTLWQVDTARAAFDQQLAAGKGPVEIRPANGLYYVHSKPCPAFERGKGCRVYDQPVKPRGCSDFPVYEHERELMVDLRCEAVNLDALKATLRQHLGPEVRIAQSADREFPFLVTLAVKRGSDKSGRRRG